MSDDKTSTTGWFRRLAVRMRGDTPDREALLEHLQTAARNGVIDADALEMIEAVLSVADLQVRDIMVPRSQMVSLARDAAVGEIVACILEHGHSRYPVTDDDKDDIAGILLAKDVLQAFTGQGGAPRFDIREYLRPAVFVPESKRVNVLLKEFRRNRNHMAIVVDEYGGVAGLVTIEDALEQIVGEIDDEYDVEEESDIRREDARQFIVGGTTLIETFNEHFGSRFPDEQFDTVAGLLLHHLGRMPRRGESISLDGFEFRVIRADRRRVQSLRVVSPGDVQPKSE
ncbi:MAG: transporter associated domain-containing protein [Steroidobacteraceae bacterium]